MHGIGIFQISLSADVLCLISVLLDGPEKGRLDRAGLVGQARSGRSQTSRPGRAGRTPPRQRRRRGGSNFDGGARREARAQH